MIRFLHTSDWQLGMTRHFLSEEAQARFTQDRIEGIQRIGRLAEERGAQFVVVAGDVFESNQVQPQTVARALEAMGTIPVPVLLLPGNHDPLDAATVYRAPVFEQRQPANVVVLEPGMAIEPAGSQGVEVVGAPWSSKRPLGDLVGALLGSLSPCAAGRLRVAVGHGAIEGVAPDVANPALIRLAAVEQAVADGRLHYLALGDRHSTTRVGDTGAVWYSGAHVATDFDETDPGNVLLVEVAAGAAAQVEPLALVPEEPWRFRDRRFELAGPEGVSELSDFLEGLPGKSRTILRLSLVGSLPLSVHAALEDLLDRHRPLLASLSQWDRHSDLRPLPDALDAADLGLGGYARAAWDELAGAAAGADDDSAEARDALALLYRLAAARSAPAEEGPA